MRDKKAIRSWGFSCTRDVAARRWFKTFLDEDHIKALRHQFPKEGLPFKSVQEPRQLYCDYMKCLYSHISAILQRNGKWAGKRVELLFSLPATFEAIAIANAMEPLLRRAGFGTGGKRHRVSFDLTEPQASGIYTAVDQDTAFYSGDCILVCDAGGGTTDLAVLEQHGTEDAADICELLPIEGLQLGSTDIDEAFAKMVQARLDEAEADGLKFRAGADYCHDA